jgi:alkylresorcinol/alkylpyrone synthase
MYLHALATRVPPHRFSQRECAALAQEPIVRDQLSRRSQLILQTILRGDSGIDERAFSVPDAMQLFGLDADGLNETFRREGPKLAGSALSVALNQAGLRADQLDALLICTCTGYLCPGLTSYVAEDFGIRPDAVLQDIVGHGCGAAIPTLRAAEALLRANPAAIIATIAVEVCSAAFYLDDDPGVLVSACLFGDGAAACIWRSEPGPTALRVHSFSTYHQPGDRDKIRFEQRHGKLRNLLHASVPALAAQAVTHVLAAEKSRPGARPIERLASHPGGRDVIIALETALPAYSFEASRTVLRAHGNMSSPSVLFVLEELLRTDPGGPDAEHDWWLVSFGAGFAVHGCRFGK